MIRAIFQGGRSLPPSFCNPPRTVFLTERVESLPKMDNKLRAYKLTLLAPDGDTALKHQSVVFSGEPPEIINWKRKSYKRVTVSDRPDGFSYLIYTEVTSCELTSIAVFKEFIAPLL